MQIQVMNERGFGPRITQMKRDKIRLTRWSAVKTWDK